MEQHLLNAQALAAARFEMASAPPLPCEHQESMVREHVESIELVQGGLVELGVPRGLAGVVAQDDKRIGLRVYLLDNSGSTSQPDGSVVQQGADGRLRQRPCTRWEEICAFAEDHARWNLKVGTPCEFILLNSMGRTSGSPMVEGRDCIHIDRPHGPETSQLQELRELLMNNGPSPGTPIVERLQDIQHRIQANFSALAQARQMIFLTIVTDGLPTSRGSGQSGWVKDTKRTIETMRSLCASLPVQLVIRLCTDEEQTIDFYNNIDEELELPLDILDDISGEAREVAKHGNDWFAYTPVLHRIREAGTLSKILDSIDERPLSVLEVQQFAELLCGSQRPLAGLGKRQFVNEIQEIVAQTPLVYDARRQEMRPIVDIPKLRIAMRVGFRGVVLPVICPCLL
mmetsp:Transcript_81742/g.205686  ORF Transcript_81742/g.205686 Transcript_81742/m.205686 type:complete len:400 (-) Transcript_81742:156-1355(-)